MNGVWKILNKWVTVWGYSLFILILCILPIRTENLNHFPVDKIVHWFIYFSLTCLVLRVSLINGHSHPFIFAFLYTFSLGVVIEIIQYFLPYRSFSLGDIFFNSLGSIGGLFCVIGLLRLAR